MSIKWMKSEEIEKEANNLLKSYEKNFNQVLNEEVPLEKMAEFHLDLFFDYDKPKNLNLKKNTLGAIFPDGKIFINESLVNKSSSEGRFRFTLAHEIGHWILHQDILNGNSTKDRISSLFRKGNVISNKEGRTILCRKGDTSGAEWQANKFAAYLLMPSYLVIPLFDELRKKHENTKGSLQSKITFEIANIFNTSIEATKIHLKQLNLNARQLKLF